MNTDSTAATQLLGSLIIAFVEANEPTSANEDFIFGQMEDVSGSKTLDTVDEYHVETLLKGAHQIRNNSGVGSPEVAKYVDTQAASMQRNALKGTALRSLAEQLYVRRPVLYFKGHPEAMPATVLLRTARKPSVGALSTAGAAAGLFKSPDNSFIVIKFDPQFGYADIIVDPFFTDAFIQQPSTLTYSALLTALPRAFVGTAAELHKMVALLTAESMKAYAEKGVSSPPWRRFDAMLARWQPSLYNDEVITHGPGGAGSAAAQRPAAAALNPSLFSAAAPAVGSRRMPQRRDNSTSSTMSTDTSSSDGADSDSPTAVHSDGFSYSSDSSSSCSTHHGLRSSDSNVSDHTVIYGFDIPSKQQQQRSDPVASNGDSLAPQQDAAAAADVTPAAVAAKLTQAPAVPAASTAAPEYSIKAVYPSVSAPSATPVIRPLNLMQKLALARTAALDTAAAHKQHQQQLPPLSSNSITEQVLAANGYCKPRVVKPIGNSSDVKSAGAQGTTAGTAAANGGGSTTLVAAGVGETAVAAGLSASSAVASNNEHVCCGYTGSSSLQFNMGRKRGVLEDNHFPGRSKTAVKADCSSLAVRDPSGLQSGTETPEHSKMLRSSRGVDTEDRWVQHVGHNSAAVKGVAAVVAEYKDTVLRVPVGVSPGREMQVTRVVAGRKIVRLCSLPGRVIQGFDREGARAA